MERSNIPYTNVNTAEAEAATGWGLIDIQAKCRALLIGRTWLQSTRKGSVTATWLQEYNLSGPRSNPRNIEKLPTNLEYLTRNALDMAHIAPPGKDETLRTFKRCVYNIQYIKAVAAREHRGMRIMQLCPYTNWKQAWKNLHLAWVPEETKSTWYSAILDVVPTNDSFQDIRFVESNRSRYCARRDTSHTV